MNGDEPAELKQCCVALYGSPWVSWLLGDSWHPGGTALTRFLGQALDLKPHHHILDVASGNGSSALAMAREFGCQVTGVDYNGALTVEANTRARAEGLSSRVRFVEGDAEALPFFSRTFDAVMSECAFCTFPDKARAAQEMVRVLRESGGLALSDMTREGVFPPELDNVWTWAACLGGARSPDAYRTWLVTAGCEPPTVWDRSDVLRRLLEEIRQKLVGVELMMKLSHPATPDGLPPIDFDKARRIMKAARDAIDEGRLGYHVLVTKVRTTGG